MKKVTIRIFIPLVRGKFMKKVTIRNFIPLVQGNLCNILSEGNIFSPFLATHIHHPQNKEFVDLQFFGASSFKLVMTRIPSRD